MVLEYILPEKVLLKHSYYGFILGAVYSIVGILFAKLIFPADPSLVAIAFTSILMLPDLRKLFSIEERTEDREKKFSFLELFKDNKKFIKTYLFITLGIFLVYTIATLILPSMSVSQLFREQLEMRGLSGGAVFTSGLFLSLMANNIIVLLACFVLSFLTGDGAIFLITWNASMWATIFAVTARNAAINSGGNSFVYILIILAVVLPHAFLEILSYILAGISGGVISKDFIKEKFDSRRFNIVFKYNVWLLFAAIVVLIIGMGVETFVLDNVDIYRKIAFMSLI